MVGAPLQASLLDAGQGSSLGAMVDWINRTLLGQLAIGLSILAVAFLGFLMLSGRLPIRRGSRVVLGIFILLGAPSIAAAFALAWEGSSDRTVPPRAETFEVAPREELPPANYDPYAGASLRRE